MPVEDITGRQFGSLAVLRQSNNFYVYPNGKKRIAKWICRCEECGREVEMTRAVLRHAKNCGCHRPRQKNKKICVICGKEFECPPSDKTVTCSPECRAVRAAKAMNDRIEKGEICKWTEEFRQKHESSPAVQAARKELSKIGGEAAKNSPLAGPFETNQGAKIWTLVDPSGNEYVVQNLNLWAREHTNLFDKPSGDKSVQQIRHGFEAISQTLRGVRGPGCKQRGSWSYFGWTLKCPPQPQNNHLEK